MTDTRLEFDTDLKGLDTSDWMTAIEDLSEEHGSFTPLGRSHCAAFLDAGRTLLVTFENVAEVIALPDAAPRGFAFARREGWSVLSFLSHGESWFRDDRVYGHVDRLIDDGFFEDFDRVLFYGAQAGGYAAAAYSVAAPGARVLALRPQATLDPAVAGWDTRFYSQRGQDFTGRYGYAPDMIDAARTAYIVHSPQHRLDSMHAALFTRPNAVMLRAHGMPGRLDSALDGLGLLDDLIRAAMDGTLDIARFARMMQARKDSSAYLRRLVGRANDAGHGHLAAQVCRLAQKTAPHPWFDKQLAAIEGAPDAAAERAG